MLCNHLVLGCCDKGTRARLFREKNVHLRKHWKPCKLEKQLKDMGDKDSPIPVSTMYHKRITNYKKPVQAKTQYHPSTCKYCGGKHKVARTKCPAYGKTCRQCGKANHFHTVCLRGKGKAGTKHYISSARITIRRNRVKMNCLLLNK